VPSDETTGDLLMAAARGLRRRYSEALAPYAITPGQGRALRVVCERGPLRLSALAEALGIVPRSATQVADDLESQGLIRREADPDDRRATVLVVTPEGVRVHRSIAEARAEASDAYVAHLSTSARGRLDDLLRALLGGERPHAEERGDGPR
jgi:DNA-binding MarR family transcriptional regulator